MAKPTIVTRAGKGSALTWTEGDTNLENLRDATIGITDGTTSGTLDLNDTLTFTAGSNVTLSYNATSKALTISSSAGASTPTQVDFTATPASTDVYFVTTSAAGAGAKDLYAVNNGGLKFNTGSGIITTDVNMTLNGGNLLVRAGGNISLYDNDDSNRSIVAAPANLTANTLFRLPDTNGSSGQVLQTDGSGNTSWVTPSAGGASTLNDLTDVVITAAATDDILRFDGTNWVDSALSGLTVGTATNSTNATNATNIVQTVNSTSATYYPLLSTTSTTGTRGSVFPTSITMNPSTGAITTTGMISADAFVEPTIFSLTYATPLAPNVINGSIQKVTLSGNLTINGFTNPVTGQTLTLLVYGGVGYTTVTSTMLFAGGNKTLSGTTGCLDIITITYTDGVYLASIARGFA